jgi:hypothetical protein
MKSKIGWILFATGAGIGLYFLGLSGYFYGLYLSQPENPVRYEYLMGVAIGSMFACPAWLAASIGAHFVQARIHKSIRFGSYALCAVVSLVFMYYLVFG